MLIIFRAKRSQAHSEVRQDVRELFMRRTKS